MQQNNQQYKTRINYQIRATQVQLIDADGKNIGTVSLTEALRLAKEQELDLVEINSKTTPIIVKIMNYGKFKYEESKKEKEAKKKQKTSDQKCIEMTPNIEINDVNHKLVKVKEFLNDGCRVKLVVKFRGRELAHKEIGENKLRYCLEELKDLISGSTPINMDNKDMITIISPKLTK